MCVGVAASGIDTWITKAVGDVTTYRVALRNLLTARCGQSVAVLRAGIQQLVEHPATRVIELEDRSPLGGFLQTSTELTRLTHDPGKLQSVCVRVQDSRGSVTKHLFSIRRVGNVVCVLVTVL